MVADAPHGGNGFLAGGFGILAGVGVVGAGIGEILPDEDAEFVADVVEVFAFVQSAAPDAEHIKAGVPRLRDALA